MLLITKVKSEPRLPFGIFEYPLILVPHTLLFCVCLLGGTPDDATILALCSRFASGSGASRLCGAGDETWASFVWSLHSALWVTPWPLKGMICLRRKCKDGQTVMRPTAQTMLWANRENWQLQWQPHPLPPNSGHQAQRRYPINDKWGTGLGKVSWMYIWQNWSYPMVIA